MRSSALVRKHDLLFILLAGLAGMALVLVTVSSYGAGISGDAVYYLSGAENIAAGKGFFDHFGQPVTKFPPLYAYLLGALSWFTGANPLQVGTALNALAFGLIVIAAGLFFRQNFDNKIFVYMGTAATLFSRSFFLLGINIFSDPLFFVLALLFLIVLQRYTPTRDNKTLLLLSLITALALLQRYISLSLILTGIAAIFWVHYKDLRRALLLNLLYGGLSSLPLACWILLRNRLQYGNLIGSRTVVEVLFWQNASDAVRRISYWFMPINLLQRIPLWLILLGAVAALLLVNKKAQWTALSARLRQPANMLVVFFMLVYFMLVAGTTFSADHYGPYDDRYICILYVPLVWLFLLLLQDLVLPHLKKHGETILLIGFIIWLAYPINSVRKFAVQSYHEGVTLYNIFNTRWFHESTLIEELQGYPFDQGLTIYSNYADTVYLYLHRDVQQSLQDQKYYTARQETLTEHLPGWPPGGEAYLVWFNYPTFAERYYTPQQLSQGLDIETLYEDQDGGLYLVVSQP